MRVLLTNDILNEKPNSQAIGAFNSSVSELVENNMYYYLRNRDKGGKDVIKKAKELKEKGFNNSIKEKAMDITIKKIEEDYKSYSERMKAFKEDKKNTNKVKKSLKGLDKGLQNAILRAI